jgi:1-acyl-sn-glycerol-3-phosphate acyltransferase
MHSPPSMDLQYWQDVVFRRLERSLEWKYFSLEVRGFEHVPPTGPVIFAANHSGWFPLDALFFSYAAAKALGASHIPHGVIHDAVLKAPLIGDFFRKLGVVPASWFREPETIPEELRSMGIFPEGAEGNVKPFWSAYRAREWKRGFVRYALARRAAILPVAILGGEESLPVVTKVRLLRPLLGADLPLPLSLVPFPSDWKVIVHAPIRCDTYGPEAMNDKDLCRRIAEEARSTVQETIRREKEGSLLWQLSSFLSPTHESSAANPP